MQFTLVESRHTLDDLRTALNGCGRVSLDCEAAGFHRYRDSLCLVQLSTPTRNFVIDPFAVDPTDALRAPLADPEIEVVMHGADFDMRLLDRDLSLRVRGLFDTQVAAALLGEPRLGLSALLEKHLDIRLSKKYQRADWARRPLLPDMLEYAALDTAYLMGLADGLHSRLDAMGRMAWVREEAELLQAVRWEEEPDVDPVTKVKGARNLDPAVLERLRAALDWRDAVSREMDRAPFRVAGDNVLLAVAASAPDSLAALRDVQGASRSIMGRWGRDLLERLRDADDVAPGDRTPYPRPMRGGPGRPTAQEEERFERLKEARNRCADALGLDRGRVFPNAALMEAARTMPSDLGGLVASGAARRWQVETVGPRLIEVLQSED